ncbi:MAG: phosphomannomutase [Chloroflexi bacterium B3_Chlor]|nr:MAG: phosphomannomutase [Chloroflexi bacterium B3_Chlor]
MRSSRRPELSVDPTIFREYDIRGVAWENLDPQVCTVLGAAYGSMIQDQGGRRIVVGRDGRVSSPDFSRALIAGLLGTGCEVIDIGVVTTPMVYFAVKHLEAAGGVVITASHNPAQYNGLKLRKGALPFSGEDIQALRRLAESGPFREGGGHLMRDSGILQEYLSAVQERVKVERSFRIVIDAGNGTTGLVAPELFRQLGCDVKELYCDVDGSFPYHLPDPSDEENVGDLVAAVQEYDADVGIAYDGDGDRLGLVSDGGEILSGDLIVALIVGEMLKREPGTVVFDLLSSRALIDVIERGGGVARMAPTGYTRVMDEVRRSKALIGGEASGHIFFQDELFDFDDGIFASAKFLEALSSSGRTLSSMVAEIPPYCSAPEIKVPCADEHKFAVMDRIRECLGQRFEFVDLDGLRLEFEDGWASVRASHTSPNIALVFEARSRERLDQIRDLMMRELAECCAEEISSGVLKFEISP